TVLSLCLPSSQSTSSGVTCHKLGNNRNNFFRSHSCHQHIMTKDRLAALKAAQSEDEQDDDMHMDTGNAQYMEEFFEQV
uniref:Uncharacterized protein n=1 Tax=Caenorhabditis japonica TaxID=281687 RepID=A0A8R1IJ82_CAEJA